ncbi:5-demethoxyubiquinol-8 5-hydroxylase UbiM [Polymorphobacter fuscus]|uniref:5-demethoxyubiquinol-8 5-hydroxylase UbiM n=1 Tax=Sandarakinorhabdus fusca TaxID=1439888 RepID=A0A7C9L023_9SPHN|nr:5-demethoxyubiquinol-8 5-hydroxylase UbiM [Polymorphobacter fuscus]KAB7643723.1 5-demethoxyubiquinol-8 5-hydroxylase UbiM [Polymorphobacter fuscus]MQT18668.1 5-demethoxyubiquinol-8 5-hydroxylase UbiM [Polymorphobacter fuscus]NJC08115.1 ubiquinone biosynthesis UbiH/UbiF/VisC/COQ6 family hydroxylase [Polymorphobacter fuscus]
MPYDVIIVGGGPAGLAFARSLGDSGLTLAVVERDPLETLAAPADDGREIALTHRSIATLKALGAWDRIDPADIAPLREARVLNGASPFALAFDTGAGGDDRLGELVSNAAIRAALFRSVEGQADLDIVTGVAVTAVATTRAGASVTLADGRVLRSRLLVGADSRHSFVRDQLGIGAQKHPLGRSMMLCRVAHDEDHHGIATEWFDNGQTIAMLPLNGRMSSAVLTLDSEEIAILATLAPAALGAELSRRYQHRLGQMTVVAGPNVYPLTITWSHHFAATRAALIGDAAVGMHPVTAHGFNLGLQSQATLARLVCAAQARGGNIASALLLRRYEAAHRLAAAPIYAATNMIVALYTDDRAPARMVRHATLRAGAHLPLVRGAVSRLLMQP